MVLPIIGARDYIDQQGFFIHDCASCGHSRIFAVYHTRRRLTLYFVPTLNVRRQTVMECMTCHGRWGVPAGQLASLEAGLMSQAELSAYMETYGRLSPQVRVDPGNGGRTLYQVMQVDPLADDDVIEAAFRRLAMKYHPDRAGTGSEDRMRELLDAHAVLSDPARRSAYDRRMGIVRRVSALRPDDV